MSNILNKISEELKIPIKKTQKLPQGMDSEVFSIIDEKNKEYVVKIGEGVKADIKAYNLIEKYKLKIPVPKLYLKTSFNNIPVLVMEKIKYCLLETIPKQEMSNYIPSMIESLKEIHKITSERVGCLTGEKEKRTWKNFHLSKFDGSDNYLKWNEICKRDTLDSNLILRSVDKFSSKFSEAEINESNYSLLHTDFNQRNLFVDPKTKKITGIIDWGESIFGDPIYDFARIRMLIWHFNLGAKAVDDYYTLMDYTPKQRELDDLYWISRIIEYLAYYSEEVNDFNMSRIKLHQDFLREYMLE